MSRYEIIVPGYFVIKSGLSDLTINTGHDAPPEYAALGFTDGCMSD